MCHAERARRATRTEMPMAMGQQWIATDFGGPEVLQLREVDVPAPGPGEVTIDIPGA